MQLNNQGINFVGKLCGLMLLTILGCNSQKNDGKAEKPKHVIVIGVDGMSPDGVQKANTPVMDGLMKSGSYTLNARGVLPTSSSSNWASMVSGAGPEKHGVTSNGWERNDFNFPAVTTGSEDIFPTIFGITRKQKPNLEIGAIYNWAGFGRLIERSALSYDVTNKDVGETVKTAVDYIQEKKPGFLFIHLDHVDGAGHGDGHKTPKYYEAVSLADKFIGEIVEATKTAGIFDETVFIISADHGGIGYSHGGETLDELEIPFIISGKGVKKDHLIRHEVFTYDNAATVAFLLDVTPPYSWTGKPVTSAMEGYQEPADAPDKIKIASPIIYPIANLYDPAGGFYLDEKPEVKIGSDDSTLTIRYTIDGSEPDENSTAYTAPFTLDKSSVVMAKAFGSENRESGKSIAYFRMVDSRADNGIQYDYYENKTWEYLPVFANQKSIASGKTWQFRIQDIARRKDHFAIRFKTFLQIDSAGTYKFYLLSDDGSKLYVNGDLVVNNDGGHGPLERTGSVELSKSKHLIVVEYHNQGGGGWLDCFYKGPGLPKQIIPPGKLFLKK